ncbi:hypothetical protein [Embleya sp. NPDC059259]|uniref:hypothetical protein n=1 Tax=unclassified Embleya TaxID=2699296 RepID=UPI0036B11ED2
MSNVAQGDISWLGPGLVSRLATGDVGNVRDDDGTVTGSASADHPVGRELPSRWRLDWVTGPWAAADRPIVSAGAYPTAVGDPDAVPRVRALVPEQPIGEPLVGHDGRVGAVTTARVGGRTVVVAGTAGWGATVRVFDLDGGHQLCRPLVGRTAWVGAARAVVAGRPVAVTGDAAGVRVWDPATGLPVGEPLTDAVWAVATAVLDGRPVVVAGADAVRVFDLTTGAELGAPLTGHTGAVTGVATAVVRDRPVAVTGGRDAARVWDLATREPIGEPLAGRASAVATGLLDGRPVAAIGGSTGATDERGTVRVWDLAARAPLGPCLLFPLPVDALTVAPGNRLVIAFGRELATLHHT